MAKEKSLTVIKKITISGGGHHGGAWKVAFADFMTAMMAFFLCMWLLSISPEARQSISDYFSTPSVIEFQFRNFGVELTLEKLFSDLLNEPLDAISKLMEPMDKSPNVFEFGDDRIALSYIIDKLGEDAKSVEVNNNEISFVIPDFRLFKTGTSEPASEFVNIMIRVKNVVSGLEKANIKITSQLFLDGVPDKSPTIANDLASARLDFVQLKIKSALEHESTKVEGFVDVRERKDEKSIGKTPVTGFLKFNITRYVDSNTENKTKENSTEEFNNLGPKDKDLYDELNDTFRKEVRRKEKK